MTALHDPAGRRLYLTAAERAAFLSAPLAAPREVRAFCQVLHFTGAGISEVLALTAVDVDLANGALVIATLKKLPHRDLSHDPGAAPGPRYGALGPWGARGPPSPACWPRTRKVHLVHGVREALRRPDRAQQRLWPWSRMTASRRVGDLMDATSITAGPHRCA